MNIFAVNNFSGYNRTNLQKQNKDKVSFCSGFEKNVTSEMEEAIKVATNKWTGVLGIPTNEWHKAKLEQEIENITGGIRKMSASAKRILNDYEDDLV